MKSRIGIYPGTFDPVHPGHVAFALEALQVCELEEVVFFPENTPRGKEDASDIEHRMELLVQALAGVPGLQIGELTSDQFTVAETLPELEHIFPNTSITLLAGSDVIHGFPYRWEGLETLLDQVSLAIGMRAGDDQTEIDAIIQGLQEDFGFPIDRTYITTPEADLASTDIRSHVVDHSRLHPATVSYMRKHGLYS